MNLAVCWKWTFSAKRERESCKWVIESVRDKEREREREKENRK